MKTSGIAKEIALTLIAAICLSLLLISGNLAAQEAGPQSGQVAAKRTVALSGGSDSGSGGGTMPDLSTGTYSYSFPIEVPAGRKGMDPGLALVYRSTNGNGWVGMGWELEVGSIERNTKNGVDYDKDEYVLRLGGSAMELVKVATDEYRTKIESGFLRIQKNSNTWLVTDKNGMRYTFGQLSILRQDDPSNMWWIFKWCLNAIEDPNGNYMAFSYSKPSTDGNLDGEIYLSRIDYTGNSRTGVLPTNSIILYPEVRPDIYPHYTPQFEVYTRYRLKTIAAYANQHLTRAYKLSYQLSGSTARSLLTSIQQFDKNASITSDGDVAGVALPAVTFIYPVDSNGITEDVRTTTAPNWGAALYTWVGDFNGDGKADIATANPGQYVLGQGWQAEKIWVKVATGSVDNGEFEEQEWFTDSYQGWGGDLTWAGDFDGDGKTDIATIVNGIVWVRLARPENSLGSKFIKQQWTTVSRTYEVGYTWAGDFNGDGKTDIAYAVPGTTGRDISVLMSNGSGFDQQLWQTGSVNWGSTLVGDFNGDGKTDIATYSGATIWVKTAKPDQNEGARFPEDVWTTSAPNWGQYFTGPGDYNGDGLMDIATVYRSGENMTIWVKVSTGRGFNEEQWWTGTVPLFMYSIFLTNGTWSGDFNGDGRTDIATHYGTGSVISVKYSLGKYFAEQQYLTSTNWSNIGYNWAGDFNGDGKEDIATAAGGTIWVREANVFPVDLLTEVQNGTGGRTTISYRLSTDFIENNTSLPLPYRVTSEIRVNDGVNPDPGNDAVSDFEYFGGYYNIGSHEFRGFNRAKITGPQGPDGERAVTETWFHQGNDTAVDVNDPTAIAGYMKGKPYRSRVSDGYGNIYSETTTTYYYHSNEIAPYFNPPQEVGSSICDGDGYCGIHTKTTYEYDEVGNVTNESFYSDAAGSPYRTVIRVFTSGNGGPNNITGLPLTEEVRDESNALVSKVFYYYDGVPTGTSGCNVASSNTMPDKGNLTRIERWYNDPATPPTGMGNPSVRMAYDSYGNLVCTRDAVGNPPATITYDSVMHAFPVTATNAKGQSATTYYYGVNQMSPINGLFGQVASIHDDANNVTTASYQYDTFGRAIRTDMPDGTWSSTEYVSFGGGIGTQHIHTNNHLNIQSWSYFDGLGRTYVQQKTGPAGRYVTARTEYNNTGTVKRSTMPYFEGESYYDKWTYFTYDAMGRTTRVDNPDGTYVTACFGAAVTVGIDADKHKKHQTRDSMGRLVKVEEYTGTFTSCTPEAGSPYAATTYDYDVRGNLVKVIDTSGNVTEMKYNSLGQKYSMTDPDMGTWTYQYDLNGSLWKQTDAKGKTITFDYDELNRIVLKDYPTGTDVHYTYDEPGHTYSVGRLTTMTDASGSTSLNYDNMGRTTTTTKQIDGTSKQIDGTSYTFTNSYLNGRLESITYPPMNGETVGETVSYAYGLGGELIKVSNEAGTPYAYAIYPTNDYTALYQPKTINYANGVTTAYTYYPQNNRLWTINTSHYNYQDPLVSLTYDYSDGGNIKSIADSNTGSPSQNSAGLGMDYTYEPGNKPHAVRTTSDGAAYTYDPNGNMESDSYRTITWNYDNMPETITNGGQTTSFVYDGNNSRVEKISSIGTTVYVGKLLECRLDACTKYIYGNGIRIAARSGSGSNSVQFFHQDHLGSTRVVTNDVGDPIKNFYYLPSGETWSDTIDNEITHKYTSQELDPETGLYNYNARLYNPVLGRFISADSIVPDPVNSQAFNRYSYVLNNPMIYTDPSGHRHWRDVLKKPAVAFVVQNFSILAGSYLLSRSESGRNILAGEIIVGTAAATAYCGGCGVGTMGFLEGALTGEVAGGISAYRSGGDVLDGVIVGGAAGGVTGAIGAEVGLSTGNNPDISKFVEGAIKGYGTGLATGYAGGNGDAHDMLKSGLHGAISGGIGNWLTQYVSPVISSAWNKLFTGEPILSEGFKNMLFDVGSGVVSGMTSDPIQRKDVASNGNSRTTTVNIISPSISPNMFYRNIEVAPFFDYPAGSGQEGLFLINALTIESGR